MISIIARAEWYLENKDLEGAAKEVNTLVGWPKRLARDWLIEARKALETEQALNVRLLPRPTIPYHTRLTLSLN